MAVRKVLQKIGLLLHPSSMHSIISFESHKLLCFCDSDLLGHIFFFHILDGNCRHIAPVLFDLEQTARANELKSCTSGQCQCVRWAKPNTKNACPLQELKLSNTGYGKQQKLYHALAEFHPRSTTPFIDVLGKFFMEGLEKVCSEAINALHVLPHAQTCSVSAKALQSLI